MPPRNTMYQDVFSCALAKLKPISVSTTAAAVVSGDAIFVIGVDCGPVIISVIGVTDCNTTVETVIRSRSDAEAICAVTGTLDIDIVVRGAVIKARAIKFFCRETCAVVVVHIDVMEFAVGYVLNIEAVADPRSIAVTNFKITEYDPGYVEQPEEIAVAGV